MNESINTKQLRSRLGSYLTQVEQGLTLVVTRQGQAIAELRPYGGAQEQNGHAEPAAALPADPPSPPPGMSALGLTAYQYELGYAGEPAPDESAADQAEQNGYADPLEAASADPLPPSPPVKRRRSRKPKAAKRART
ncbi:MAG: hypothetical protein J4F42_18495 [Desulfurellaceae bacterium]|nr:hypothetical protein [Desulfurellaceae bacterium]